MRLRLETTTRAPYWLVGDPLANARSEQSEALTETLQITRNVQTVAGAGFDTQLHFDRGQQKIAFDATCNRIFTTGLERLAFLASLAPIDLTTQRHLWEGTAWLREDSGTSFIEYALPQCVIMLTGTQLVGTVGLNLTYRIQAGGFSTEREGTSLVKLIDDLVPTSDPTIILFLTETGGEPFDPPDPSSTWPESYESSGNWKLDISANYTKAGVTATRVLNRFEIYGSGYSPPLTPGYTPHVLPPLSLLSTLVSALHSDLTGVFDTIGGRNSVTVSLTADDGTGPLPSLTIVMQREDVVVSTVTVTKAASPATIYLKDSSSVILLADSNT